MNRFGAGFEPPVLRLDGKARTAVSVEDGGSERAWQVVRASEYSSVELELPSKGEGALYLLVTSEGVPEIPTPTGSEGVLRLSRTWQRADGSPLSVGGSSGVEPELGDLVYSVLHVTNGSSERVSHVALVDRFAAGLEVENPRLGGATRPEWLSTGTEWEVEHMNVRDDRVEVFGSLGPGETVSFAYALRAVTAGSFTAPSAEVEAMYDPRLRALSPSASVEVRGPWGDLLVAGD